MPPRAYWKGYLKLSLVSCPIALFPATSEREKISFHQLNKKTGHRIKYRKVAPLGSSGEAANTRLSLKAATSTLYLMLSNEHSKTALGRKSWHALVVAPS